MLSIRENFLEVQLSFFKAAIYQTYLALGLPDKLNTPKKPEGLAEELGLKPGAFKRFLNAAASIGLVTYDAEYGNYADIPEKPTYNDEPIIILFWLIKNAVPDLIKDGISEAELIPRFGVATPDFFNKAVKLRLLNKTDDGRYSPPAELLPFLLSGSKDFIGPKMTHYEYVMYPMWSVKGLIGALQTGKSQWREIFGADGNNPFEIYRAQPKLLEDFSRGLHYLNQADNMLLAGMFHFDAHCILDVGGGSGAWALALLSRGTAATSVDLYELSEAIPLLSSIFYQYAGAGEERVSYVSGSFFDNPDSPYLQGLPEDKRYDLVNLGWILHDWNDEVCLRILRKVRSHLKPSGTLVVLESILPQNRIGPACIGDLSMLLQTEGCERTFAEYEKLLKEVGFDSVEYSPTPTRRQLLRAKLPLEAVAAAAELTK